MLKISPIEIIYDKIKDVNFNKIPTFTKIIKSNKINGNDNINDLNHERVLDVLNFGEEGKILKKLASNIYYLELVKKDHINTAIKSSNKNNDETINSDFILRINYKKKESIGIFDINITLKDKKHFIDIKKSSFNYWSINKSLFDKFEIIDSKQSLFSGKLNVISFIKMNYDPSKGNIVNLELTERNNILYRNNNSNDKVEKVLEKKKEDNNESINEDSSKIVDENQNVFTSDIEDYIIFIYKIEGLLYYWNLFCSFFISSKAENNGNKKKNNEESIDKSDINDNKILDETNKDKKAENEEKEENQENSKNEENDENLFTHEREMNKKIKELQQSYLKKKEFKEQIKLQAPIYMSVYDLYKFRIFKCFNIFCTILLAILMIIDLSSTKNIDSVEKSNVVKHLKILLNNPIYEKIFDRDFNEKDFTIFTKKDFVIWLDFVFSNFCFVSRQALDQNANGNFTYTYHSNEAFFHGNNTYYEMISKLRIGYQLMNKNIMTNNSIIDFFNLNNRNYIFDSRYNKYSKSMKIKDHFLSNEYFRTKENNDNFYDISKDLCKNNKDDQELYYNDCFNLFDTGILKYDIYKNNTVKKISGLYADYEGEAYFVYFDIWKNSIEQFTTFIQIIKDSVLIDQSLKLFTIDLNFIHIYFRCLVKVSVAFEFNNLGNVNRNINVNVSKKIFLDY